MRPRLDPTDSTTQVNLSLLSTQARELRAEAARAGCSVAEIMRRRLRAGLLKDRVNRRLDRTDHEE